MPVEDDISDNELLKYVEEIEKAMEVESGMYMHMSCLVICSF